MLSNGRRKREAGEDIEPTMDYWLKYGHPFSKRRFYVPYDDDDEDDDTFNEDTNTILPPRTMR